MLIYGKAPTELFAWDEDCGHLKFWSCRAWVSFVHVFFYGLVSRSFAEAFDTNTACIKVWMESASPVAQIRAWPSV